MRLLILMSCLIAVPAMAAKQIVCEGANEDSNYTVITATLENPTLLTKIELKVTTPQGKVYDDSYASIEGISDPSQLSPQLGTRFYFHSGNTSHFLLFKESVLENVIANEGPQKFMSQEIYEQYERDGSQFITNLPCQTL